MLDAVLIVWLSLTAIATVYVAWDAFTRTPEMPVMKWGWVLVTLYTGAVGGALYVLACQEPRPGMHEDFVRPLWKQGLGSTIHCLAGDATGIILAAAVTTALGFRMWQDLVAEYLFGFAVGLLVFQALFMRDMLGGSYGPALRKSFVPEWLSMNAVMAGMVPVMVVLMTRDVRAMEPGSLRFWGAMSLAILVGGLVAYPVNVWLVAAGLKHGMGTVRALGAGGHGLGADRATSHHPGRGEAMSHGEGSHHEPPRPTVSGTTRPQIVAVAVLTLVALGAGVFVADLAGDLRMRGSMIGRRNVVASVPGTGAFSEATPDGHVFRPMRPLATRRVPSARTESGPSTR